MSEIETTSKNRRRKKHFGRAQDLENQAALLQQELLGVFMSNGQQISTIEWQELKKSISLIFLSINSL